MKNQCMGLLVLAFILILPGCDLDDVFDCERGFGDTVSDTLDLQEFDRIRLEIPATIYLTQGDFFQVIAEGRQNIIHELELDVQDGEWDIDFDRCVRKMGELNIFITMPDIQGIIVESSGDVISENTISGSQLDLLVRGSGRIDAALDVQYLDARIRASGDIYLEGTAHRNNFRNSASGNLLAFGLITDESDLDMSGSGDAQVYVTTYLKVKSSGSGDVYYKGDPELDISTSGSGDIFNAN